MQRSYSKRGTGGGAREREKKTLKTSSLPVEWFLLVSFTPLYLANTSIHSLSFSFHSREFSGSWPTKRKPASVFYRLFLKYQYLKTSTSKGSLCFISLARCVCCFLLSLGNSGLQIKPGCLIGILVPTSSAKSRRYDIAHLYCMLK